MPVPSNTSPDSLLPVDLPKRNISNTTAPSTINALTSRLSEALAKPPVVVRSHLYKFWCSAEVGASVELISINEDEDIWC